MRSNIRQVAERAGVSRTTVSNVLLGRRDIVAIEKWDLVLQAARDLDYTPIRHTLQNRHVKTHVIAVPFKDPARLTRTVHSETYAGLCEEAENHGYDVLMLLRADPDWAVDGSAIPLLDRRSDGIIFASPNIGETGRTFETLARADIPAVACYRRDLPPEITWIDVDNQSAMSGAVHHLFEMGHRRIVHLTGVLSGVNLDTYDNRARRHFFSAAMREHGLHPWSEKFVETEFFAANSALVQEILGLNATAVVAMNDLLAVDLKKAVMAAGLSVPDDLSIVGMDGALAQENDVTSMEFSFIDIGRAATRALMARFAGMTAEQCCYQVPVTLASRGSVGRINP